MNKSKVIQLISTSFLILIILIGVSYAYFRAIISNGESKSTIIVNSGLMNIEYNDNSGGVIYGINIAPGWSTTKSFTISGENTVETNDVNKDGNMYYKIGLVVDSNTFSFGALTYSLTATSTGQTNDKLADERQNRIIPQSGTTYIGYGYFGKNSDYVDHSYDLTIEYPSTDLDQSDDNGKTFTAHVIVKSDIDSTTEGTLATNIISNNLQLEHGDYSGNDYVRGGINDTAPQNNYIEFGNEGELWRIMGIYQTYNADTGETVESVKIIRNDSLGNYSWDTSLTSVNGGYGVNAWNDADLMKELNTDYLNASLSQNTNWFDGLNDSKKTAFSYTKTIKDKYQRYIMNTKWYLSGWAGTQIGADYAYYYERGGTGSGTTQCDGTQWCTDTVIRRTEIISQIGLPTPSDYGYASSGNCQNDLSDTTYCTSTYNWLTSGEQTWLMTQWVQNDMGLFVFSWKSTGALEAVFSGSPYAIRPVLYLTPDTKIISGTGTKTNPYKITK